MHWLSPTQKCWWVLLLRPYQRKESGLRVNKGLDDWNTVLHCILFPYRSACPCSTYLWAGPRVPFYHWCNCYITLYSKQSPWTPIVFVHLRVCCLDQRKPLVTKHRNGAIAEVNRSPYTLVRTDRQQVWDKAKLWIYKPGLLWLLHTKYPEF